MYRRRDSESSCTTVSQPATPYSPAGSFGGGTTTRLGPATTHASLSNTARPAPQLRAASAASGGTGSRSHLPPQLAAKLDTRRPASSTQQLNDRYALALRKTTSAAAAAAPAQQRGARNSADDDSDDSDDDDSGGKKQKPIADIVQAASAGLDAGRSALHAALRAAQEAADAMARTNAAMSSGNAAALAAGAATVPGSPLGTRGRTASLAGPAFAAAAAAAATSGATTQQQQMASLQRRASSAQLPLARKASTVADRAAALAAAAVAAAEASHVAGDASGGGASPAAQQHHHVASRLPPRSRGSPTMSNDGGGGAFGESRAERTLRVLLADKFKPIDVPAPVILRPSTACSNATATPQPGGRPATAMSAITGATSGGISAADIAATQRAAREMNASIALAASNGRRSRRLFVQGALAALRTDREAAAQLSREVKQIVAERKAADRRRYGRGDRSDFSNTSGDDGDAHHQPPRSFVATNLRNVAEPERLASARAQRRAAERERRTHVRTLHDEIEAHELAEAEAALQSSARRGAERSRDRKWASLVAWVLSARALYAAFESKVAEQFAGGTPRSGAGSLAHRRYPGGSVASLRAAAAAAAATHSGIDERRNRRKRWAEELDDDGRADLAPLIDALRSTRLPALIHRRCERRRAAATRFICAALRDALHLDRLKRSAHALLVSVRNLQRHARTFLHVSLRARREALLRQFEWFQTERVAYNRAVCAEIGASGGGAAGDNKKDNNNRRTASPPRPPTAANATATAPSGSPARGATPLDATQTWRSANDDIPLAGMSATSDTLLRLRSNASGGGGGGVAVVPQIVYVTAARRRPYKSAQFADELKRTWHGVVAPLWPSVAHRNPRLGADPLSARAAALETHPLYAHDKIGARAPPRLRDRLLVFVADRERESHSQRLREWRAAMAAARRQHAWLLELASLQEKMKVSPAREELRRFAWPARPIRRILLTANEMRLLVLVAYALLAQERRLEGSDASAAATGGAAAAAASGASVQPTAANASPSPPPPLAATTSGAPHQAVPPLPATTADAASAQASQLALLQSDGHIASTLRFYASLLNLPNVTPAFVR